MNRLNRLLKLIQRRVYDFLQTKYGLTICTLGSFIVLILVLQLSDTILESRVATLDKAGGLLLSLNYLGHSRRKNNDNDDEDYARILPIDVVYTWVNGSDPEHVRQLVRYKYGAVNASSRRVEYDEFLDVLNQTSVDDQKSSSADKNDNHDDDDELNAQWPCYHKLCIQTNNLFVVRPALNAVEKKWFIQSAHDSLDRQLFSNMSVDYVYGSNLTLVSTNDFDLRANLTNLRELSRVFKSSLPGHCRVYLAYYTIDCGASDQECVRDLNRTFILKRLKKTSQNNYREMLADFNLERSSGSKMPLSETIMRDLIYKRDFVHTPPANTDFYDGSAENLQKKEKKTSSSTSKNNAGSAAKTYLSVLKVKTKELDSQLNEYASNETMMTVNDVSYDVYRANLVWDLGSPLDDEMSEHRFADNNELKYSLRSLEKHAKWIRNVYIVTNGQVPDWLNVSHPKIRLVTHQHIFPNKSHLPTFSSPAIESHLHRIDGLSERFLYFNDDLMLGAPIWPEDFYTRSKGYRFHLAWSLPGCNPNCPNAWISDGYCDRACNTTECEFDGGDCDLSAARNRTNQYENARQAFVSQGKFLFPEFYCAPGCSTSWLADKYCDNACNNLNCSFDMGDCGVDKYISNELLEIPLYQTLEQTKIVGIPSETFVFYFNFSSPLNVRMLKATYEENQLVRTIAVVNKFSILTVLLMPDSFAKRVNQPGLNVVIINLHAAYNQTDTHREIQHNMTLLIELNSYNRSTTVVELITKRQEERVTRKRIQIKQDDLGPKLIPRSTVTQPRVDLTKLKYENQVFQNLYQSYLGYLRWSMSNGYLTENGLMHKLAKFDEKVNSEWEKSYRQMMANVDLDRMEKDDRDEIETLFDILFNSSSSSSSNLLNQYERSALLDLYLKDANMNETSENVLVKFRQRKLLDTFADSLRYVNRLYNQIYGYSARKVPAHMPHLIDRSIMADMQSKFRNEFDKTSGNRFRTAEDMQFSFSYYYFVMNEIDQFNASHLFAEYDLNLNSQLDPLELSLINLRLSSRPFSASDVASNAASVSEMYNLNPDLVDRMNSCNLTSSRRVTHDAFVQCTQLVEFLADHLYGLGNDDSLTVRHKHKYKFETLADDEIKFIMLSGDPLDIEVKLNNYLRQPQKFLCLNDNIDYKLRAEASRMNAALQKFYQTLYPLKSSFEKEHSPAMSTVEVAYSSPLSSFDEPTGPNRTKLDTLDYAIICVVLFCVYALLVRLVIGLKNFTLRRRWFAWRKTRTALNHSKRSKRDYKPSNAFQKRKLNADSSTSSVSSSSSNEGDNERAPKTTTTTQSSTSTSSCVLVDERQKSTTTIDQSSHQRRTVAGASTPANAKAKKLPKFKKSTIKTI